MKRRNWPLKPAELTEVYTSLLGTTRTIKELIAALMVLLPSSVVREIGAALSHFHNPR